jgi:hypothetical protein
MTQAVTVTAGWEAEVLGECVRCGGEMTIAPHVMGIEIAPGAYLCDPCYFGTYHGSRAAALAALGPEGDGDDDPAGGPAAPALAPVELAIAAARSARPFTHLSELSDAERAEYEAWAAEVEASAPLPEPCCRCGRPASPFETTPEGAVVCWRCWPDRPTAPTPAAPAARPAAIR